MVKPPVPSDCSICFTGCISYPCSSQKSWVMVDTCTPVSMRAVAKMSPTKKTALLNLQIKSTVASRLWDSRPVMTFTSGGLCQHWHRFHILFVCWGRFYSCSPSWSLKALCFRCWSTHVTCAPTLAVIALDLLLIISSSSLILIASVCAGVLITALPSEPLAIVIGILIVISLTLIGCLSWVFLWCLLSPFNGCQ